MGKRRGYLPPASKRGQTRGERLPVLQAWKQERERGRPSSWGQNEAEREWRRVTLL
jgi:hypothetical protein